MKRTCPHRPVKLLAVSMAVCAVALLSGCVENAKSIRDAQAAFSRASQIENSNLLGATQGVQDSANAATNYRVAATTTKKLIADKGGDLKKDNLLCTAMMIEAFSWWRLGDYDSAMKVANGSSNCTDSSTPAGAQPTRDLALFQALPGLIRIDQANQILAKPAQTPTEFATVMKLLSEANDILQGARSQVPAGHPLQLYLIQSQLAIVRNWQEAYARENLTGDRLLCESTHASQQQVKLLAELVCASYASSGQPQDISRLLDYWSYLTGSYDQQSAPAVLKPPATPSQKNCDGLSVPSGFPDTCQ